MCEDKKQNSSHVRAVKAYLKPKNHVMFEGYVRENGGSESAAVNIMVKDFFARLPENERVKYLSGARTQNTFK